VLHDAPQQDARHPCMVAPGRRMSRPLPTAGGRRSESQSSGASGVSGDPGARGLKGLWGSGAQGPRPSQSSAPGRGAERSPVRPGRQRDGGPDPDDSAGGPPIGTPGCRGHLGGDRIRDEALPLTTWLAPCIPCGGDRRARRTAARHAEREPVTGSPKSGSNAAMTSDR